MTNSPSKINIPIPPEAEDQLEIAIQARFEGRDLEIYRMMAFQLGYDDDRGGPVAAPIERRLHGSLLLAVAQALHGDYSIALKYAVSLELMHNFALIHGDVQDGNTERLGRPSVWWKWGPSQAINTGDGMHAMARLALFELCDEGEPLERVNAALGIVDDAVANRCEGEYLDISFQERPSVTVDEYLDMVTKRVGSLYGASAELASVLRDDLNAERRAALRRFGESVGVVKQLVADHCAYFGTGERDPIEQGRIISKKKSLPLAHLFDTVQDPTIRRRAGEMFMQRVIDPSRISELISMTTDAGAREFTMETIETHLSRAESAVCDAGLEGDSVATLMSLARDVSDLNQIVQILNSGE